MSSIIAPKPVDRRKSLTIKIDEALHDALVDAQQSLDAAGYVVQTDTDMAAAVRRHLKKILTDAFNGQMLPAEKLQAMETSFAELGIKRSK